VCHLGFKIKKKPRSNIKRIPRRCLVLHSKDYDVFEICKEGEKKDSYESRNKIDDSHDSTQSLSNFVIPGDIPGDILNIDSSVFADEIFSEFFDIGATSSSQSSGDGSNNKYFELHDSIESIVNLIIPGDIPDMKSLMLKDIKSLSDFFMDI